MLEIRDPEILGEIQKCASNNFTLKEIAAYLLVEFKDFKTAFNAPGSIIKRHYDKGKLQTKFVSIQALRENAEGGNITAFQILAKDQQERELSDLKESILYTE